MNIVGANQHRKDIDGLRAIAILLVVVFHCAVPWFSGGFIGVDVFFVISGYLIGGVLYREGVSGAFQYLKFYARRVRRIAPALVFMIVSCAIFAYFIMSPTELRYFSLYSIAGLISVPNVALWMKTDYFSPSSELNPLLMTWSLGIEEQFYVFFPPLVLLLCHRRRGLILALAGVIIVSFLASVLLSARFPLASFYLLHTRAWELASGALLYLLLEGRDSDARFVSSQLAKDCLFSIGLITLLVASVVLDGKSAFPGYVAAFPVLATCMMIAGNGRLSRIVLCSRPMTLVGLVSYSWYLWHWPALSFARMSSISDIHWTTGLCVAFFAFFVAYLSYRFVETPFRTHAVKLQNKGWVLGYVSVALAIALPLGLVYQKQGVPSRVDSIVRSSEGRNPCLVGYGATGFNTSAECIPPHTGKKGLALLGDSHASALRAGVNEAAQKAGYEVYQMTKSSCPFLVGTSRRMRSYPQHFGECDRYNQDVLHMLRERPEISTVVLSGYWAAGMSDGGSDGYRFTDAREEEMPAARVFEQSIDKTVQELASMGKRVIVIDDAPLLEFDPKQNAAIGVIPLRHQVSIAINGEHIDLRADTTDRVEPAVDGIEDALRTLARTGADVQVFSIVDQLCKRGTCVYKKGDVLYYSDSQHLSSAGAEAALTKLNAAL